MQSRSTQEDRDRYRIANLQQKVLLAQKRLLAVQMAQPIDPMACVHAQYEVTEAQQELLDAGGR